MYYTMVRQKLVICRTKTCFAVVPPSRVVQQRATG